MARYGSGAALARELVLTRQAVSKAEAAGRITRAASGEFDLDAAAIQYRLHTDPDQQGRALGQQRASMPAAPVTTASEDWHKMRARAEALKSDLEYQELAGLLVRREDEARAGRALAASIVTQLEPLPDRFAAEFGTDDAMRGKMRQRLREELDRIRAAFSGAGLAEETIGLNNPGTGHA